MAITTAMCNTFKQELLGGVHDLDTDTLKIALIKVWSPIIGSNAKDIAPPSKSKAFFSASVILSYKSSASPIHITYDLLSPVP